MSKRYEEIGDSEFDRRFYAFSHAAVNGLGRLLLNYRVEGTDHIPKQGRGIINFNHLAWPDVLFGPTAVPERHVSVAGRRKFMEMFLVSYLFKHWGAVIVDRGQEQPGREALAESVERMKEPLAAEKLLLTFASPNTRTPGVKPGRPVGIDRVAMETQTNVMPAVVKGTDQLMKRLVVVKFGPSVGYPETPRDRRSWRRQLQETQLAMFDSIDHPGHYIDSDSTSSLEQD